MTIREGKTSRTATFEGTSPGSTEGEIRENFRYWQTLHGKSNEKLRAKVKEAEESGMVSIVSFTIVTVLGLETGLQFKNNPYI